MAWPRLSSCNPCAKTAPLAPAAGLGDFPCRPPHPARVHVPGAQALVVAASSLPTHPPVPSCAALIVSIATGEVKHRTWGNRGRPGGAVCVDCSGVSAGSVCSAAFSPLVWRTALVSSFVGSVLEPLCPGAPHLQVPHLHLQLTTGPKQEIHFRKFQKTKLELPHLGSYFHSILLY